jgi:myosin-5
MRQEAAAVLVQKYARRWLALHAYKQTREAILVIQCSRRAQLARRQLRALKEDHAALTIQVTHQRCDMDDGC